MAVFEVDDIYDYDKEEICQAVYGTTEDKHPGCASTDQYKDKFLGGKIALVSRPKINPPYDLYFIPPLEMRKRFREKGWERIVAHQTRNVPHTGHEWLMKGAWFQSYAELSIEKPLVGAGIVVKIPLRGRFPAPT